MSTGWDVYCVDCDEFLGLSKDNWNHAEEWIWSICADRLVLKEMAVAFAKTKRSRYAIEVLCGRFSANESMDMEFFVKHGDHNLAPRNEYGHVSGMCGEYFRCPACDLTHSCVLLKGHDGNHRRNK